LVAELLEVGQRHLPKIHRADHPGGELQDTQAQPVLASCGILREVTLCRERINQPGRGAFAQAGCIRDLGCAELGRSIVEYFENGEGPFDSTDEFGGLWH